MMHKLNQICLAALACSFVSVTNLSGQTFDSVTFGNVIPDVVGSGDFRTYTIQNGGDAQSLMYSGTITEIDTITYVSEVTMEIFGSGYSIVNQILDDVNDFQGTFDFFGWIPVQRIVDPGDTWSFIFRENLDDGSDGLADASLDITFEWSTEPVPEPAVSELGEFPLNQGVYERNDQAGTEFPYRVVPIEVSEDGDYTLEIDWQDLENGGSFDGYLYLLDEPFAGTDSTAFISNDDFLSTATSRLTTALDAGITYYALLTTFSESTINPAFAAEFSVSTFNGGTARVVSAIPEPGGLLVLGCFACGSLVVRRNRVNFQGCLKG
jgi:hypothetical protein